METENQIMLLRDADIEPTNEVLENALGKNLFGVYSELVETTSSELGLEYEWRYYKDGHAWLCKVTHKKKTIFWLSVWEKCIKTGFYFTEKTRSGIFDLLIKNEIKHKFENAQPIGKLLPLGLEIDKIDQLKDLMEIIKFKKELK
jgi:hypothetical protein